MTVSYQYEVASSTSGGFTRLLFMWRGSLYKLIYRELLLFLVAFGLLSALYRNLFTLEQKRLFEKVVIYCDTFINLIPLSFVLGFYVAYVAGRWWQQYMAIPWPDKVMHSLALYIGGNDDHGRMLRRTLMRYLNLSLILVLRSISSAVKRRFPTMDHLVEAGFMTAVELQMFQSVPNVEFNTYWIPCTWFICLLKETKNGSRISDTQGLKVIVEEFNEFRSKCGLLWSYDWISIPLVYTQVVTLATYSFFLAALVGRQYVDEAKKPLQMEIDIYIPVFTILQFFFFMGLLKVAEQLINPFGDDDEDFELNWLIDRHTKVSYLGVDTLMTRCPPLVKDKYFDEIDLTLPYTGAAVAYKKKTYRGSVYNMQVPEDQQSMFLPEIAEEDDEDRESVRRGSAKTLSSSNTNISSSWPSAGIWRPNVDTPLPENSPPVEDPLQHVDFFMGRPIGPKKKGVPWHAAVNPVKPVLTPPAPSSAPASQQNVPFFDASTVPTIQHWSSNSTIESYCSTSGVLDSNPFDNSFGQQYKGNDTDINSATSVESAFDFTPPSRLSRNKPELKSTTKRSSSYKDILGIKENINKHLKEFSRANEHPKLHRLLARRQSSSSGQWKGVRWKPVLDNSAGDVWSGNMSRYSSGGDLCQNCKNKIYSPSSTAEDPTGIPISRSNDSLVSSVQSIDDNIANSPSDPNLPQISPPVSVVMPVIKQLDKSDRSKSFFILKYESDGRRESVTSNSLPNIASCYLQNQITTKDDQRSSSSTKNEVEIQIEPLHNKVQFSLSHGNLLGVEQNRIHKDSDTSAQSTV